jgi:hypothetical protein
MLPPFETFHVHVCVNQLSFEYAGKHVTWVRPTTAFQGSHSLSHILTSRPFDLRLNMKNQVTTLGGDKKEGSDVSSSSRNKDSYCDEHQSEVTSEEAMEKVTELLIVQSRNHNRGFFDPSFSASSSEGSISIPNSGSGSNTTLAKA